eukprot:GHVU01122008.1.p2 GENE.GHVU01122008.1~~GHVU01122008.1.p2  ORF type:complete len:167 (+),score=34.78 GHVU01122008.1:1301-1801(+)
MATDPAHSDTSTAAGLGAGSDTVIIAEYIASMDAHASAQAPSYPSPSPGAPTTTRVARSSDTPFVDSAVVVETPNDGKAAGETQTNGSSDFKAGEEAVPDPWTRGGGGRGGGGEEEEGIDAATNFAIPVTTEHTKALEVMLFNYFFRWKPIVAPNTRLTERLTDRR